MSKKHIEPTNAKGQLHGLCIYYWGNGNVHGKYKYVNGKLHGMREYYGYDGVLTFNQYWINGRHVYCEYYGSLKRVEFSI